MFVSRRDIEWTNVIYLFPRWVKLLVSYVLGGPNTDRHGRTQYPMKYSGFFLVVVKYASGIRTTWLNAMPMECVKTNIPILVNTLSMSEAFSRAVVMRLATPTGVNLIVKEKKKDFSYNRQRKWQSKSWQLIKAVIFLKYT